jgi:hypothetical protein
LTNAPVFCADGSCAATARGCPLVPPCDQYRCNDGGSCRAFVALCPAYNACPGNTTRCATGHCMPSGTCPNEAASNYLYFGCPTCRPVKCPNSGLCVGAVTDCAAFDTNANGCPISRPIRCVDGTCQSNTANCPRSNGCPAVTPIRCAFGDCVADASTCPTNETCTGVRCPNLDCKANLAQCLATNNCPTETPYRCADETCAKYPPTALAFGVPLNMSCTPQVVCDPSGPQYRTSMRECERGEPARQVLCFDGVCRNSPRECMVYAANIHVISFDPAQDNSLTVCGGGDYLCPDGACMPSRLSCRSP